MTNAANQTYISHLENFFEYVDSETLFNSTDSADYRRLRDEICDTLIQLLVWQRPFLEAEKGLDWPYAGFKKRISFFEKSAREHTDPFIQMQACLFLARLPFPRQWFWLAQAQKNFGADPEIKALLKLEKKRIEAKLDKKKQKQYMLISTPP